MRSSLKAPWEERPSQPATLPGGFSWLSILPLVLSLIASSTDTIGILRLNGLFTAHITGNQVVLATHLVSGDPAIVSYVLAVPIFAAVLPLPRLLASGLERVGVVTLQVLLLLELLLLIISRLLHQLRTTLRSELRNRNYRRNVRHFRHGRANRPRANLTRKSRLDGRHDHECCLFDASKRAIHVFPVIVGFAIGCALGAAAQSAYGS